MRYEVFDSAGGSVSLEVNGEMVELKADDSQAVLLTFTKDQFKQLRRAVGYLWTELEGHGE